MTLSFKAILISPFLTSLIFASSCQSDKQEDSAFLSCKYKLAYVNFSGQDVKVTYSDKIIYSGFISSGDPSTGINFIQEININNSGKLKVVIDNASFSVKISNPCQYDVVYIQPYEPMLLVTDDHIPLLD